MVRRMTRRALLAALAGAPVAAAVAPQAVAEPLSPGLHHLINPFPHAISADIEHALMNAMVTGRGFFRVTRDTSILDEEGGMRVRIHKQFSPNDPARLPA